MRTSVMIRELVNKVPVTVAVGTCINNPVKNRQKVPDKSKTKGMDS